MTKIIGMDGKIHHHQNNLNLISKNLNQWYVKTVVLMYSYHTKFRTISKIVTDTPQDIVIPIEVYLCGECGEVHTFIPKELQDLDK